MVATMIRIAMRTFDQSVCHQNIALNVELGAGCYSGTIRSREMIQRCEIFVLFCLYIVLRGERETEYEDVAK